MDQAIVAILERIKAGNERIGNECHWADSVSQTEVDSAQEFLGATIPEDVLTLFRWSNGLRLADHGRYQQGPFHGHASYLLSLENAGLAALSTRSAIYENCGPDSDEFRYFRPYPAVVVAEGWETLQVVVSLAETDVGSVWLWQSYGRVCTRAFDSFRDYLELQAAFLETGVVKRTATNASTFSVDLNDPNLTSIPVSDGWRKAHYWP